MADEKEERKYAQLHIRLNSEILRNFKIISATLGMKQTETLTYLINLGLENIKNGTESKNV